MQRRRFCQRRQGTSARGVRGKYVQSTSGKKKDSPFRPTANTEERSFPPATQRDRAIQTIRRGKDYLSPKRRDGRISREEKGPPRLRPRRERVPMERAKQVLRREKEPGHDLWKKLPPLRTEKKNSTASQWGPEQQRKEGVTDRWSSWGGWKRGGNEDQSPLSRRRKEEFARET